MFSFGITMFDLASGLELPSSGENWHELRCGYNLVSTTSRLVLRLQFLTLAATLAIVIIYAGPSNPKPAPCIYRGCLFAGTIHAVYVARVCAANTAYDAAGPVQAVLNVTAVEAP